MARAVRLFCFPHAGGGPSAYRRWLGCLEPEIEVFPVGLPGREDRFAEPAYDRLDRLAERVAGELEPHLHVPHVFFGHSMGAALAWEVARRTTPLGVIASARRAPQLAARSRSLADLPTESFVAELGSFDGTPREVLEDRELLDVLLPTLRADFAASENFLALPDSKLRCGVVAMAGADDQDVHEPELAAWGRSTTGPFRYHVFRGGHFYLAEGDPEFLSTIRDEVLTLARSAGVPQ